MDPPYDNGVPIQFPTNKGMWSSESCLSLATYQTSISMGPYHVPSSQYTDSLVYLFFFSTSHFFLNFQQHLLNGYKKNFSHFQQLLFIIFFLSRFFCNLERT